MNPPSDPEQLMIDYDDPLQNMAPPPPPPRIQTVKLGLQLALGDDWFMHDTHGFQGGSPTWSELIRFVEENAEELEDFLYLLKIYPYFEVVDVQVLGVTIQDPEAPCLPYVPFGETWYCVHLCFTLTGVNIEFHPDFGYWQDELSYLHVTNEGGETVVHYDGLPIEEWYEGVSVRMGEKLDDDEKIEEQLKEKYCRSEDNKLFLSKFKEKLGELSEDDLKMAHQRLIDHVLKDCIVDSPDPDDA